MNQAPATKNFKIEKDLAYRFREELAGISSDALRANIRTQILALLSVSERQFERICASRFLPSGAISGPVLTEVQLESAAALFDLRNPYDLKNKNPFQK